MKFRVVLAAIVLVFACLRLGSISAEQRTWTAAAGGFTTVAEFIELKAGGTVSIRLTDGTTRDVPLEKLSAADRQYVTRQTESSRIAIQTQPSADSKPVTLTDLQDLEAEAQRCKTARDAARLYTVLLAKANLPADVRSAAEQKSASWQKMATANMVRFGKSWIPGDQYLATRRQAGELIKHALELIRLNQDKLAYEKLVEASKLDPDSIQADFIIATVFAVVAKNYDKANQHFENCRRRDPDNMAVLNNLALTEIKLGRIRNAINHWKAAAALGSDQRLVQNVGRLIDQAGKRRVAVPKSSLGQLSELYAGMVVSAKVEGASKKHGWQYMLIAAGEPEKEAAEVVDRKYSPSVAGFGSGFVVAEHYLLTNRHVAQDATGFDIIDPTNPTAAPAPATLVAICETADLAILKCESLSAKPVALDPAPLRRGTDVMVLGYPDPTVLGAGLKSTRGSISALPSKELDGLCLYDAVTNPGNSGGPVCDARASVIAIHCAGFNTASRYGGGVPMEVAVPFIQKTVPDFSATPAGGTPMAWPEVDERVSKSTVLILVKMKEQDVGLVSRVGGDYLEDRSCNLCSGRKQVKCPVRNCARGTVPSVEVVVTGRTPAGAPIYGESSIRVTCSHCRGDGVVTCPLCHGSGRDPEL